MTTVRDLHSQAMQLAQSAMVARHEGDTQRAEELARRAYELEEQAVALVPPGPASEPTLSILYRSAASLALQSGQYDLAQRQIAKGLLGYPPREIRRELKHLEREIDFRLLLHEKGFRLEDAEFELSVEGDAVGPGTVYYSEFIRRLEFAHKQLDRTIQRLMKKDYQLVGRIAERYRPFTVVLSAPEAGSFAVSIKLATPEDKPPPLFPEASEVVDVVIKGIQFVDAGDEAALRSLIPEEGYYRSFLSIAHDMAPDGERISAVRFRSKSRTASLTRQASETIPMPALEPEDTEARRERVVAQGILDYASSRRGQFIGLSPKEGPPYKIAVTEGMDDVVRAHYGSMVSIAGLYDLDEKLILLEEIREIDE